MNVVRPKFCKICDGIPGSEGPVFDATGSFYVVAPFQTREIDPENYVDGVSGTVNKIDLSTGALTTVSAPSANGYGGRPSGCQFDKEGNMWIADMRLGILKFNPVDRTCKQVSSLDADGNALKGCNDLIFDDDGNLWVTAPGTPIAPADEDIPSIYTNPQGLIYCLEQGASVPILVKLDQNIKFSNGIVVQGENTLLVAESLTQSILAFDIEGPGKLSNKRLWAKLPADVDIFGLNSRLTWTDAPIERYDTPMGVGGPDGMDFDATGRLIVAHHGASHLEVFTQDGKLEKRIECPFKAPSNLHFKPKTNLCYVTEHDSHGVWMFEWESKGKPMYCE